VREVHQAHALLDAAVEEALFHLQRDVDELHPLAQVEPQFLAMRFHILILRK
jgi:hypothetical protein